MEKERIENEMHKLENIIQYRFHKIDRLAFAMGSIKIEIPGQGDNASEYRNEGLATVGDTILKSVITDYLFRKGIQTKGELTEEKKGIESNDTMHKMTVQEGIIKFAYNNLHFNSDSFIPDHEKVVTKKHDPYIEAIVGAVFYDSDYETTRKWIYDWLLPKLEFYSQAK